MYKNIIDTIRIYGDKLPKQYIGWIDKDGIEILDEVRVVFHNDLYMVVARQLPEREVSHTIPYSDIRSIHGMKLKSITFEHDDVTDDMKPLLEVKSEIIGDDTKLIDFNHVTKVLKRLMNMYGYQSDADNHTKLTETRMNKEWYIRLEEFIKVAYDVKIGWKIDERMGLNDGRGVEWKRRLNNTLNFLLKHRKVSDEDKNVLKVLYERLMTRSDMDNSYSSNINYDIKNEKEVSLLRRLMFTEHLGNTSVFKPVKKYRSAYDVYIDMMLEKIAMNEIRKVTGVNDSTLYGWATKTKNNLKFFNDVCKDEILDKISEVFV